MPTCNAIRLSSDSYMPVNIAQALEKPHVDLHLNAPTPEMKQSQRWRRAIGPTWEKCCLGGDFQGRGKVQAGEEKKIAGMNREREGQRAGGGGHTGIQRVRGNEWGPLMKTERLSWSRGLEGGGGSTDIYTLRFQNKRGVEDGCISDWPTD